ncbi:NADH-quinone oxidoreductase subunit NuoN [Mumia sp. zg.B53]|uniref:NADH-quinone oxidoreductase subunit NuoN n=1 Tax=unclassified Mumia TaxID=2621872 RepID=UPI001C6DD877|nr:MULTISPECIES: NADH-quinone oxidoreductase subunit NuoN [unclassified Mumia]MBW9204611.1 NADH-quinone oxidoreductase subunit NuoN [Mumia sp. zg.B17]MBW9209384.1 NADH-quinone oxidoreductase subunit NuoN [Mumia sp. zg.B21]MBW9213993.1 NADH-quinone oxidoreductase subunit NuoN [Mumia sp. zg.B53]
MLAALPGARSPIDAPDIDYGTISPLLIVLGVAVAGVLVEAFVPRAYRFVSQVGLAAVGVVAAFGATVWVGTDLAPVEGDVTARGGPTAMGALSVDGPAVVTWAMLLFFGLLGVLLFAERRLEGGLSVFTSQAATPPGSVDERRATRLRIEHSEVFPLAMFALAGMMFFASANDLLGMFVALEVLSLPLYLMCGLARRRRLLSQEAAMKYFLLGAFSSAFFLYGIALVYGYAGSFDLAEISTAVSNRIEGQTILLAGMALILVGLLFKVAAVPFHAWTPDVYQGAPTPVTAFMAAGTKAAAFIAMLRIFFVAFGGARWDWAPTVWAIAIVTMLFGAVVSIAQTDVKRMLAYSSIAHAGFLLVAMAGMVSGDGVTSVSAVLFYLIAYGAAVIGAFAVVTLVRDAGGETTHLSRWAGLGKESPVVAVAFTIFLLSFAGIPLTGGFIGKWTVFAAAWEGGAWPLVVVGVVASAIALFFYVRVVVLLFFAAPQGDGPSVAVPSPLTWSVVGIAVAVTIVLGVLPDSLLDLVQQAGAFVR